MKKLHDQDLVDIVAELDHCQTPRAEVLKEQIAGGDYFPLNKKYIPGYSESAKSVTGKSLSGTTQIFPKDQWECPILSDDSLPWPFLPTAREIQETIKENIKCHPWQLAPSTGTRGTDVQAAMELLDKIPTAAPLENDIPLSYLVKPDMMRSLRGSADDYHGKGSIIHLSSPQMDVLRTNRALVDGPRGTLEEWKMRMMVMPTEGVRELQHCDHYVVSTLITGIQLWVVFSWNELNLEILREVYKGLISPGEDAHRRWVNVIEEMHKGVVFIQRAGETAIIPPFWPHLVFSVKTSVSATFYLAKAVFFPKRLENIELWQLANRCWDDTTLQQRHLVEYASNLLDHLRLILKNDVKGVEEMTIRQICSDWDDVKGSVYTLLTNIQDVEKVREFSNGFRKVWTAFLEERARKPKCCRICDAPINMFPDMRGNFHDDPTDFEALGERLGLHFSTAHWPQSGKN